MTNKTQPTGSDPVDFIQSIEDTRKRDESLQLLRLFQDITGYQAQMWGPSIIGFGKYEYHYDSGRSGTFFRTGFSPRKNQLSIYIMPGLERYSDKLAELGPHKTGKSCLYIKRLSDIQLSVLESLIRDSLDHMDEKYPINP